MDRFALDVAPIGVKIFREVPGWADQVAVYSGPSFCDAVNRATSGEGLMLRPGSISVCKWSPLVLGLAEPAARSGFEASIEPRLPLGTRAVYVAHLDHLRPGVEPDVVIVRARPETIMGMLEEVGRDQQAWEHVEQKRVARSALGALYAERENWRAALAGRVNRALAAMNRAPGWRRFTEVIFRSNAITAAFDQLIKRTMADMSICRNSTAIPMISGKANASFFCTGGIAWGGNDPKNMTSGWPWEVWKRINSQKETF